MNVLPVVSPYKSALYSLLVASDVQAADPCVTAITMATMDADLNIAVLCAKVLDQHQPAQFFPEYVHVCAITVKLYMQ